MAVIQHRRALLLVAVLACNIAFVFSVPFACGAAIPLPRISPGVPPQVAIYYDGPQTVESEGPLDARQVLNLLGHFSLTGEIISLNAYKPGALRKYRAAFFVGTASGTQFPAGFLD